MTKAYILAAGKGKKIWPYGEIRNKSMIPVATKPVIDYLIEGLEEINVANILIGASMGIGELRKNFRNNDKVSVIDTGITGGTSATVKKLMDSDDSPESDGVFVFYGDVLIRPADLIRFRENIVRGTPSVLVTPVAEEDTGSFICCSVENGLLKQIVGHPRGDVTHRFSGFYIPESLNKYIFNCGEIFHDIEVGMMPPIEENLEIALSDFMKDGGTISLTETEDFCLDLDKPWHILQANAAMCRTLTGELTANVLAEGASIDETARISGFVKLGKNSRIGNNVTIKGNVIVGENTIVENGAIFAGNAVVGDNSSLSNYCYIDDDTVVGNKCVINHCAEISGAIMDTVYLYHYMEIYGLLGEGTDIGAATVCGSLRFDDGITIHKIRGRKEFPSNFSEASYIGDFCRTGVNAIIMPGCKMGPYSILGSGVLLEEDLPSRTSIRVKQELIRGSWGPERYGW